MDSPGSSLAHVASPSTGSQVSSDFRGTAAEAVLSVKLEDRQYDLKYPMPEFRQSELFASLAEIQQRYQSQTDRVATLERGITDAADRPGKPWLHHVENYLRCQGVLEQVQTALEISRDKAGPQDSVLNRLHDISLGTLNTIRNQLRSQRTGLEFVRWLLQSQLPALIDLGTRLAGEPSMRPELQNDLFIVVDDETLRQSTRQRAYDHLWAELRKRF